MASGTVVLLGHNQSIQAGLFAGRWLMDELWCWRLGHQSQDKRHDSFPLFCVEWKLRHPIPLVIGFVFGLFVIVAAGCPQLLPEKTLPLVSQKFFKKKAGIRIDRLWGQMGFGC